MVKGSSLGLALPEQSPPTRESFDLRSGPLSKWLKALPIGNTGETTKLLYGALHDVNRHTHGWARRFRFMEMIREPLDTIQRAIGKRYTGLNFPLPPKTRRIPILSQRLHMEMAIGYMAAMESMQEALFLFQDRNALKVMVHRSIRHLSQSLLTAYQVYGQQQTGTWKRIHTLYAFAEAENFHQDPIKDPLWEEQRESSIARIYKQIALLAATSPYRLRQGEAVTIHQALGRWAAHAKLLKNEDDEAAKALFTLHLDSDAEPEYRSLDYTPCDGTACRYLDTRQLVRFVQEEAAQAGTTSGSLLTQDLYKRLIHDWKSAPTRSERRNEGGDAIEVVIGMIQIHQLLAPTLQSKSPARQTASFAASPGLSRSHPPERKTGGDVWNIYTPETPHAPSPPSPPEPTTASLTIQHWQIVNESVGGFRLAVPEGQEVAIRVGEVLAVREIHSPQRWHLTVVRWIRQYDQGAFETGLQIIASDGVPVLAKNLNPGKDRGEFQRGLLLPDAPERDQPVTVLLPNRLFNPAERVLLHGSDHQTEIVLGKAIQNGGSFVQFEFGTGEKKEAQPSGQAAGDSSPFEKLWGQL